MNYFSTAKKARGIRFLLGISVFILFFICSTININAAESGTISVSTARVRNEASTSASLLGSLPLGTKIEIKAQVKGSDGAIWYQIPMPGNRAGFVRSDLVTKLASNTAPAAPAPTVPAPTTPAPAAPAAPTNASGVGKIAKSSINVRTASNTTSAIVCNMQSGEMVTITGKEQGSDQKTWYKVTFTKNSKSYSGYIRSDLLTITQDATVSPSTNPTQEAGNANQKVETASGSGVVKGTGVRVRAGAATATGIVITANAGTKVIISGKTIGSDQKVWYQISIQTAQKRYTGFIHSDFLTVSQITLKPTNSTEQPNAPSTSVVAEGVVKGINVRVRSKASVLGSIVGVVSVGQACSVIGETKGDDGITWYNVNYTVGANKFTGYIRSDFFVITKKNTPDVPNPPATEPTVPSPETTKIKTGIVKGTNINVRQIAVIGPSIAKLSTGVKVQITSEAKASDNNIWYQITFTLNGANQTGFIRSDFIRDIKEETVSLPETPAAPQTPQANEQYGTIKGIAVRIRSAAITGGIVCQLNTGDNVKILSQKKESDNYVWYEVSFTYSGAEKKGFVRSDLVNIVETIGSNTDADFEKQLEEQKFPESYRVYLRALHKKYPAWKFQAVHTSLKWADAVLAESKVGLNLVSKNAANSWKSTDSRAYNWETNTWYTFDGGAWVAASESIIQFYLDPRNFLDESGVFQFESLNYQTYQTPTGVQSLLNGSFMQDSYTEPDGSTKTYADTFIEAGKNAEISPYHLAARCYQEQGSGTSGSISGRVSGYENLFNYFNVGAYAANGNSPIIQGLKYASGTDEAYARPWSTRYASIIGGSKFVSQKYVKRGQNTLYFQKFNVVNSANGIYSHQYMTNLQAATAEAAKMKKAYTDMNAELVFLIPVYLEMPDSPCVKPDSTANPNNFLKELYVDGYEMLPIFEPEIETFYLTVPSNVDAITIGATPVAATSSVSGTGSKTLAVGENKIKVICKSQAGVKKVYTIIVTKGE